VLPISTARSSDAVRAVAVAVPVAVAVAGPVAVVE